MANRRSLAILAIALALACAFSGVVAFNAPVTASALKLSRGAVRSRTAFRMSEEEMEVVPLVSDNQDIPAASRSGLGDSGFFSPNSNMRLGSSKDQDGKSNVWAVEPRMAVEDGSEDKTASLVLGGGVLAAGLIAVAITLANLPSLDSY